MAQAMTFRDVQALAHQSGLVMSRDLPTLRIRLRRRNRRTGPRWVVETLQEALAVIAQRAARTHPTEQGPPTE